MKARAWLALTCAPLLLLPSKRVAGAAENPHATELAALLAFEEAARSTTDWAHRRRADLGPDPFALLTIDRPGRPTRFAGLLRGADAIVLLDEQARELDRAPTPPAPTGLARTADGDLLVVGEQSPEIARFRLVDDSLGPTSPIRVPGVFALRDVATAGDRVVVLDPVEHRILAFDPSHPERGTDLWASCEGPVRLLRVDRWLVASCLLEGALRVFDEQGRPLARIVHDGPLWSIAGTRVGDDLVLAAGGVENHPLDRSDGAFGYIDSFAFVYRVDTPSGKTSLLGQVNLSELGVVTPKWIEIRRGGEGDLELRTAGYATEGLLTLAWPDGDASRPAQVSRQALPPGTTDMEGPLAANPLLDAWVVLADDPTLVAVEPRPSRSRESRIGEALFFTNLMAPWNGSEGPRSRFTCETCHHEGYVDGRTHSTGRGNVRATTKPLVGLHGNRPYFSRALDPTMARMVNNEFRVANKKNGRDPWFAVDRRDVPWLRWMDDGQEPLSPVLLRRSLMTFLIGFEHAPNPVTRGRSRFTANERRGAEIFRDRCERCHAARLVSDDPASHVPFDAWEENLFSAGTIVWGRKGYEKTGVVPYVHRKGARVPSLRRLYVKRPYFTNGSAADLDEVLARVRVRDGELVHSGELEGSRPLRPDERAALRSFLGLL